MTTTPIKLTIEEPKPGAFVWKLLQTDTEGTRTLVLCAADDTTESYELALAIGQRALDSEIRKASARTEAQH